LALLRNPVVTLFGGQYLLFDVGGVVAIGGIVGTLVTSIVANVRALYMAEPLPRVAASVADQRDGAIRPLIRMPRGWSRAR
jgi:hypothetical protein